MPGAIQAGERRLQIDETKARLYGANIGFVLSKHDPSEAVRLCAGRANISSVSNDILAHEGTATEDSNISAILHDDARALADELTELSRYDAQHAPHLTTAKPNTSRIEALREELKALRRVNQVLEGGESAGSAPRQDLDCSRY